MAEVKTKKNRVWWTFLKVILVIAQAAISIMLVLSIIHTNIVGTEIIVPVIIILLILLILNLVFLVIRKKSSMMTQIIGSVIALIIIIGGIFALRYTDSFNNFLSKVTEQKPETIEYGVVVKNDSSVKELSQLAQHSVGFLKTDVKAMNAEQYLQSLVKIDADFYDDIDTMVSMLDGSMTDAIVLETDRIEILKEEMEGLEEKINIIYTFEIELESEDIPISEKEVTTEPFIVYISGSDSRNGIKATARSDVNIIVVVNPKTGKILLASIPRDTYVQLHDTTGLKDKLTHAGVYGINMSKTTIEDFLGISIDYTIKVSFETVVKVVDELDGIDITSDQAMKLRAEGKDKVCEFTVGTQHVDGDCALRFARERKAYKTGDRHRGENQQQVITSIIGRLAGSRDYLLKVPTILEVAADSFETSIPREDIAKFIRMQLANGTDWKVESIAVDGTGSMQPTYSMGANRPLYVMIPSEASVAEVKNKITEYLNSEGIVESENNEKE